MLSIKLSAVMTDIESTASWEAVKITAPEPELHTLTKAERAQKLIEVVESAMLQIYLGTFERGKAERIAAAAWTAQLDLGTFLPDARLRTEQAKNLLKQARAQADRDIRSSGSSSEKKRTENQIEQLITSDPQVITAEESILFAKHEAEKWECVLKSLIDAHVFFRNLNK